MEPATGRFYKVLGEAEAPTPIIKSDEQLHKIDCPYCGFGYGVAHVTHTGGRMQVDAKQILHCNSCKRPFKIRTRVILVGQPIEEALQHEAERTEGLPRTEAR